jgi:hypothetical protein
MATKEKGLPREDNFCVKHDETDRVARREEPAMA